MSDLLTNRSDSTALVFGSRPWHVKVISLRYGVWKFVW